MVRVSPSLYEGREGVFSHWVGGDRGSHFPGGNFCLCVRKMRGSRKLKWRNSKHVCPPRGAAWPLPPALWKAGGATRPDGLLTPPTGEAGIQKALGSLGSVPVFLMNLKKYQAKTSAFTFAVGDVRLSGADVAWGGRGPGQSVHYQAAVASLVAFLWAHWGETGSLFAL